MSCRFSRPCSVTSTRANRLSSSTCATSSRGVAFGLIANFRPLSDSDCHASSSSGAAVETAEAAEAGAVAASVVRCTSPSNASPEVVTARPDAVERTSTCPV